MRILSHIFSLGEAQRSKLFMSWTKWKGLSDEGPFFKRIKNPLMSTIDNIIPASTLYSPEQNQIHLFCQYLLQNVEILVDPLIMLQQTTLKLVLWETPVNVAQLVLPMWTVNFGFSSQTLLKWSLHTQRKSICAFSNGT